MSHPEQLPAPSDPFGVYLLGESGARAADPTGGASDQASAVLIAISVAERWSRTVIVVDTSNDQTVAFIGGWPT